jgi:hypothetical protein
VKYFDLLSLNSEGDSTGDEISDCTFKLSITFCFIVGEFNGEFESDSAIIDELLKNLSDLKLPLLLLELFVSFK